jgi:hypothetical protein
MELGVNPVPWTINMNAPLFGTALDGTRGWWMKATGSGACPCKLAAPSSATKIVVTPTFRFGDLIATPVYPYQFLFNAAARAGNSRS